MMRKSGHKVFPVAAGCSSLPLLEFLSLAPVVDRVRPTALLAQNAWLSLLPSHMLPSMMVASGSMPADVDATVGVFVLSSPLSVGITRSSGSLGHTTRPSTALLLNKPFLNPCARHRFACHLFLASTSIMRRRISTTWPSSSSPSLRWSFSDQVLIHLRHFSGGTSVPFFSAWEQLGTLECHISLRGR